MKPDFSVNVVPRGVYTQPPKRQVNFDVNVAWVIDDILVELFRRSRSDIVTSEKLNAIHYSGRATTHSCAHVGGMTLQDSDRITHSAEKLSLALGYDLLRLSPILIRSISSFSFRCG